VVDLNRQTVIFIHRATIPDPASGACAVKFKTHDVRKARKSGDKEKGGGERSMSILSDFDFRFVAALSF